MTQKKRAVVICPGRGTYNKEELGYLAKYHANKQDMIAAIDSDRRTRNQITIAELDAADKYNMRQHSAGENASSLIYGCARGDFLDINQDEYDIVAITGNSMGWYIASALAGALSHENGAKLINTMGSMMTDGLVGGQAIYPIVDDNWQHCPIRTEQVQSAIKDINQHPDCELYASIQLGGYMVFGGNEAALKMLSAQLPEIENRYPMRLFNHAAFHTPLMQEIALKGQLQLPISMFNAPEIPLVDGEGTIWQPHSTSVAQLYHYTLDTQVKEIYNFSKAIEVSLKEFAPEVLIITGPGATLGGAVAQTLIAHNWYGLSDKASFVERQKADPVILAMGLEAQRKIVC